MTNKKKKKIESKQEKLFRKKLTVYNRYLLTLDLKLFRS